MIPQFNGRVGNLKDFIEGTDQIQDRNVADRKINRYGELLIYFLVSSNCCMVNGRKGGNVFTSVSAKGKAVVDYCIVGHENLHNITDFMITEAKDVYERLLKPKMFMSNLGVLVSMTQHHDVSLIIVSYHGMSLYNTVRHLHVRQKMNHSGNTNTKSMIGMYQVILVKL